MSVTSLDPHGKLSLSLLDNPAMASPSESVDFHCDQIWTARENGEVRGARGLEQTTGEVTNFELEACGGTEDLSGLGAGRWVGGDCEIGENRIGGARDVRGVGGITGGLVGEPSLDCKLAFCHPEKARHPIRSQPHPAVAIEAQNAIRPLKKRVVNRIVRVIGHHLKREVQIQGVHPRIQCREPVRVRLMLSDEGVRGLGDGAI